ncbi:hypothetical protein [Nocardia brevicatena]|uniref:hypothetical protein n=1 Tax=Nocardia brevicatena TaxID=37327 RepID=UPI00031F9BF6|nr:hypothetical protein [Nocardia brevicatena]
MGKHSVVAPPRRTVGSIVVAGAFPLVMALVGNGTANAAPQPDPLGVEQPDPARIVSDAVTRAVVDAVTHLGLEPVPAPLPLTAPEGTIGPRHRKPTPALHIPVGTQPITPADTLAAPLAAAPVAQTATAVAPTATPVARPGSDQSYLAPLGRLHAPVRVPAVEPIQAPPGKLRVGNIVMDSPGIDPTPINEGAAQVEAGLATFLDSVGMERSRSDRIAAQTLGSAAIGASVGSTVASPLAATSAMVGAVAGFISGIPFLPIGLLIGPILGGAIGYAVIAAPAMAVGAAVGGAVGAADGLAAAPYGAPPAETPAVPTPAAP